MLTPTDRVILISGANRGIGKAVANHLSALGYRLSLGVRDVSSVSSSSLPADTHVHTWDALSPDDSSSWVQAALDHYGRIDGVVMNAGLMLPVGIEHGSEADLDAMWAVNFKGPLKLMRAALPALRQCGHGRLINMVSLSGKRVLSADTMGYAASKFAAMALTHAVRQGSWESGVRATAVCPGLVETDMTAGVQASAGQFKMSADAIAATVAYALSLPNDAAVAEILVNSRLEASI